MPVDLVTRSGNTRSDRERNLRQDKQKRIEDKEEADTGGAVVTGEICAVIAPDTGDFRLVDVRRIDGDGESPDSMLHCCLLMILSAGSTYTANGKFQKQPSNAAADVSYVRENVLDVFFRGCFLHDFLDFRTSACRFRTLSSSWLDSRGSS